MEPVFVTDEPIGFIKHMLATVELSSDDAPADTLAGLQSYLWASMVGPALAAGSVEGFHEQSKEVTRPYSDLLSLMQADLRRRARSRPLALDEHAISEAAAQLGGDAWGDAVEDAFRSIRWCGHIARRLQERDPRLGPEQIQVLLGAGGAILRWRWTVSCLLFMVHRPDVKVVQPVRDEVLRVMGSTATEAYVLLRSIQLFQEEVRSRRDPDAAPTDRGQSEEDIALEAEAEAESRRLLRLIQEH